MNPTLPRIVVLDDYEHAFLTLSDWSWVQSHSRLQVFHAPLKGAALLAAIADADVLVLMRDRTPVNARLIEQMHRLKLLLFTGTRNQALDVAALQARGVAVCHTGWGPSKDSTAELTWAMILAAYKHLPANMQALQAGQWRSPHALLPILRGETLGLLGLGEIGSRVAAVARAFGMRVIAWSPHLSAERAALQGAEAVALETVLSTARVVSLHLVLGPSTRHLLSRERLALMRPDALLVNTSRSALIDTADLIEALQAGRPGHAALDVFDDEPLPLDHPLRQCQNLLLTPHLGFVARPVFEQFVADALETVTCWLQQRPLPRQLA